MRWVSEMPLHRATIASSSVSAYHQGDIVVEDDDIFGDGVNVAARLEGLAEPGVISVSARVQEDVAGRLDLTFEYIGEQNLKNIARPVRLYRVRLATAESTPLPFQNMSGDPEHKIFRQWYGQRNHHRSVSAGPCPVSVPLQAALC
jgi:hypothetical protein